MSKKKAPHRSTSLSPVVLLRPRLDGLWQNPAWAARDQASQLDDLSALTRGIRPDEFLPIVIKAYQAAPAPAQAQLAGLIPTWLQQQGQVDALAALVASRRLADADLSTALTWLETAGVDVHANLPVVASSFFAGLLGGDDLGSQGLLSIFWHVNQQRVRGAAFLIDYNPPWEGAIKDISWHALRHPERDLELYRRGWEERGVRFAPLAAAEAKRAFIDRLRCNREQGISLHHDIVAARQEIVDHILSLPDAEDTPPFTTADFDALSHLEQRTEDIMHFEHTVGRRVRMEDGKELMVFGADQWADDDMS